MKKILLFCFSFVVSPFVHAVNDLDVGDLNMFAGYNFGFNTAGTLINKDNKKFEDQDWQFYNSFMLGARNDVFRGMIEYSPVSNYKTKTGEQYSAQQTTFSFDYLATLGRKQQFNTKLNIGVVSGTNIINSQMTGMLLGGQIGLVQQLKQIDLTFNIRYLDQISVAKDALITDYNTWQLTLGVAYVF